MSDSALRVGDQIRLTIVDLAFGGEGVGRVDNLVVFVPWVVPGELVEVKITESKRQFARADLIQVIQTSPDRVEPLCPYFGECGGCQYQHIDYPAQVRWKHKQVSDLLQRLGGIDPARVAPTIPCPSPYHYRNRILVRSQWNKPGRCLHLGFIRHDCGLVADIESCAIAEPPLNTALTELRAHPPPKGGLKTVLRIPPEHWDVPEHSFFQNNFLLLPRLVETVRNAIRDGGARRLIDVFCGVGFFCIEAADLVESFVGIELDRPAILAARRNAARRHLANGEFIAGDADEILPRLVKDTVKGTDPTRTTVLLDPPRTGCRPASLAALIEARPAQVLYVSCHPATLARDLKTLVDSGAFRVEKVTPLDMFPQTQHVECVADLRSILSDPQH